MSNIHNSGIERDPHKHRNIIFGRLDS